MDISISDRPKSSDGKNKFQHWSQQLYGRGAIFQNCFKFDSTQIQKALLVFKQDSMRRVHYFSCVSNF